MHAFHKEILQKLQLKEKKVKLDFNVAKYLGTQSGYLNLSTGEFKKIIKEWAKLHKDIQLDDFIALLLSFNNGKTFQEKAAVGDLLIAFPKLRRTMDPDLLDKLLENRQGWAEIDVLCQSAFDSEEILENWKKWEALLKKFVSSKNISKRRASLVLLTKSVRHSPDEKLAKMAFSNIQKLQTEREILITKAVSWLLRSLTTNYPKAVGQYLEKHKDLLPAIAYRETKTKLETGRKTK